MKSIVFWSYCVLSVQTHLSSAQVPVSAQPLRASTRLGAGDARSRAVARLPIARCSARTCWRSGRDSPAGPSAGTAGTAAREASCAWTGSASRCAALPTALSSQPRTRSSIARATRFDGILARRVVERAEATRRRATPKQLHRRWPRPRLARGRTRASSRGSRHGQPRDGRVGFGAEPRNRPGEHLTDDRLPCDLRRSPRTLRAPRTSCSPQRRTSLGHASDRPGPDLLSPQDAPLGRACSAPAATSANVVHSRLNVLRCLQLRRCQDHSGRERLAAVVARGSQWLDLPRFRRHLNPGFRS